MAAALLDRGIGSMNADELVAALRVPMWRLCNLYWITDKGGRRVRFVPNEAQRALLDNLWYRNLVLKARQRGFSTLIQLMMLDTCLFNDNIRAGIIAQDRDAAGAIFRDKIKYAYDNLPPMIHAITPLEKDSTSELLLANNSSLRVATSLRSGTLQFLHVSEFGKICAKFPDKAREVLTGSLPAVDQGGTVFIESTAEGREGAFFEMCQQARAVSDAGSALTRLDMRFHFHSWWDADEYEIHPAGIVVSPKDTRYFEELEAKIGREISPAKRAWYVTKRRTDFANDDQMMRQEYPSTPDEAFEQSTDGTYYATQLSAARLQGRITAVPYDPRVPVNTFWDIGVSDNVAIWFHQRIGLRDHFISFYEANGEPYSHYVSHMQSLGYVWGKHYLPHDAGHRRQGTYEIKTPVEMVEDLGLRDIEIVPRIDDVTHGIQMVRDVFGACWFDETNCAEGIKHLELYRKDWNDRLGVWSARPRKSDHNHAADALRQFAQGYREDTGYAASTRPRRRVSGMAA